MWIGWSQPPPSFCRVQISRVPNFGAAETRPKSALSLSPPFVPMPHGPRNEVTGSLVVWSALSPKTNVRVLATGMADRSGFGTSTAGTWLMSGWAGSRTMRNSRNFPTHGSLELPESAWDSDRVDEGN